MTTIVATKDFVSVDRLINQEVGDSQVFLDGNKFRKTEDGSLVLICSGAIVDNKMIETIETFIKPRIVSHFKTVTDTAVEEIGFMIGEVIDMDEKNDGLIKQSIADLDLLHRRMSFLTEETILIVTSEGVVALRALESEEAKEEGRRHKKNFHYEHLTEKRTIMLGSGIQSALTAYMLLGGFGEDYTGDHLVDLKKLYRVVSRVDTCTSSAFNIFQPKDLRPLVKEVI